MNTGFENNKTIAKKAFKNQLASVKMEGYSFSTSEIKNVKRCLSGELTFQQFTDKILKEIRKI